MIGASTLFTDQVPSCDVTEFGFGNEDYWLLKLDSAGNKEWDKRWGGFGKDLLNDVMQLSDGSYIAAGISYSDIGGSKTEHNRDATLATGDYWIVHFKAQKVIGINESEVDNGQLIVYPNPVHDQFTLSLRDQKSIEAQLTLYDITGRKMLQKPFNGNLKLDIESFAAGLYIIEVIDRQNRMMKAKVIKQ